MKSRYEAPEFMLIKLMAEDILNGSVQGGDELPEATGENELPWA